MHTNDPFSPPIADPRGAAVQAASGVISEGVLDQLRRTRPWVRFLSVVGFVTAGLVAIAGLGMSFLPDSGAMPFPKIGLVLFYFAFALFYIPPSLILHRYATSIRQLLAGQQLRDLEEALNQQRAFWRFVGIVFLVMMALYAVGILVAVIIAVVSAAS